MVEAPVVFCLSNGIRIVHQPFVSQVLHCGIFVNTGTREEEENEKGLAHFIEHVLFKGTEKRKAFHILNRLEVLGGELNAYTTKEETCIHASIAVEHVEKAIELLADILQNSNFPEKEIEKEKEVVLDEIKSCLDNPSEQIYDDFEELVFKNHPLSSPILGREDTVRSFNRKIVQQFIDSNYNNNEIVFASTGNLPFEKIKALCEKYLGTMNFQGKVKRKSQKLNYKPFSITEPKSRYQSHCIIGSPAYHYNDKKRIGLILLNNLLGGPGMNSRLNLNLREKNGIAYNIYSCYTTYSDSGCFSIYLGTDAENIDKSITICKKELKLLRDKTMGAVQLKQAKQQLIGQILLSQESRLSLMQVIGKSVLNYDRVESLEEIFHKIESLSASGLQDIANEIFEEKQLSFLIYNT